VNLLYRVVGCDYGTEYSTEIRNVSHDSALDCNKKWGSSRVKRQLWLTNVCRST